jgi:hypothetical protein
MRLRLNAWLFIFFSPIVSSGCKFFGSAGSTQNGSPQSGGGCGGEVVNQQHISYKSGGAYDPKTDTWRSLSTVNALAGESYNGVEGPTAIWTGAKMLIWGNYNTMFLDNYGGGAYDASADSWSPFPLPNAPAAAPTQMAGFTTIWTGVEMIVWGGGGAGSRYVP